MSDEKRLPGKEGGKRRVTFGRRWWVKIGRLLTSWIPCRGAMAPGMVRLCFCTPAQVPAGCRNRIRETSREFLCFRGWWRLLAPGARTGRAHAHVPELAWVGAWSWNCQVRSSWPRSRFRTGKGLRCYRLAASEVGSASTRSSPASEKFVMTTLPCGNCATMFSLPPTASM